jgi:hypothetical protein
MATITVRPETLSPGRESAVFVLGSLFLWLLRALIVWGFLAIFFPALGTTYVLVLAGLYVLRHVLPPNRQELVTAIKTKK